MHVGQLYNVLASYEKVRILTSCNILQRPDINLCTTLPFSGYYIHAISGDATYTSHFIDDNLGRAIGRFSVTYNNSFDQELEPNAVYAFTVHTQSNIEIPKADTPPSSGK